MKLILVACLTFAKLLYASPEEGKAGIEDFLQDPAVKNVAAPNYQTGANYIGNMKYEIETEKHLTWQQNQNVDPTNLEQLGANQAVQEKIGEQIINADRIRPRFDEIIDLKLIEHAESFAANPEQELLRDGTRGRVVTQNTQYTIKTCQHSRAPEEHQCIKYLKDPNVEVKPAEYRHWWCSVNRHEPDDPSCKD